MSNANARSAKAQQVLLKKTSEQTDTLHIFNLLTSPLLYKEVEALLPAHRERIFPPTETLSMFVAQVFNADRSCQNAVDQAAVKLMAFGQKPNSVRTGAYCKARSRLPIALPQTLAKCLGSSLEAECPSSWRWKGRRLRVVDGTSVTMPDTPENQAAYPQQRGQKKGLGFPIMRLLAVMDLCTGSVLDAAFGRFNGKRTDEKALLREVSNVFESGDVLLGDAFFPSYIFMCDMMEKGVDILMEQFGPRRKKTDFKKGIRLGAKDHIITIPKPASKPDWIDHIEFDSLPETIEIREFSAKGKTYVSTLVNKNHHPKRSLSSLYKRRWEIETNFGQIKSILGMDVLACKTPEMVAKEVWVHLLAYNLIRLLMTQSAFMVSRKPTDLSFKHCLQLWLNYLIRTPLAELESLVCLFEIMGQVRVGNRGGRIEPRAIKRRPKAYPLLMKPRPEARAIVAKFGHPKKVK